MILHYRNHGVTAGTDIPLVIPHSACCSALLHGRCGDRAHPLLHHRQVRLTEHAMYWVMAILPFVLLLLGFPIFLLLLVTSLVILLASSMCR